MADKRLAASLIAATASVAMTPLIYAYYIPARTWCHVPYISRNSEFVRETFILLLVLMMGVVFLLTIVSSLKNVKNPYLNIWIFLIAYTVIISAFAVYFYTFGLTHKDDVLEMRESPDPLMVQNILEYFYFSLANSIFMTTPEYEPCPSLWLGVTLQRICSLFIALGATLLSARLTEYIKE